MEGKLLEIKELTTTFKMDSGKYPAIENINLTLNKGETLCVVGESGSGKTITSLSLMQLLPNAGEINSGEILFQNKDLLKMKRNDIVYLRGKSIAMIFQDPMSALDPVYTCGSQIVETIRLHEKISKQEAYDKTIDILKQVRIPNPETAYKSFPHELSGGMCQRVVIAMALCCNPELLIADEPTTALDVTVQAEILDLLKDIKDRWNMGILFITHDLGVVANIADRVSVMYAGKIVEESDVTSIFYNPKHPYTKGLIKSIPQLDQTNKRLYSIQGSVPGISAIPKGCNFHPRCPIPTDKCLEEEPELEEIDDQHKASCWNIEKRV